MKKSLTERLCDGKECDRDSCTGSQGCGAYSKSCEVRKWDCEGKKARQEILTSKKTFTHTKYKYRSNLIFSN